MCQTTTNGSSCTKALQCFRYVLLSLSELKKQMQQVREKFDVCLNKFLEHDHKLLKTFTSNAIDGLVALLHASSKHERLTSIYELLVKDEHLLRHFQSYHLKPQGKQILDQIIELFGVPVPVINRYCFALEHSIAPISGKVILCLRIWYPNFDAVRLQTSPPWTAEWIYLDWGWFTTTRGYYQFIFGTEHHVFRWVW